MSSSQSTRRTGRGGGGRNNNSSNAGRSSRGGGGGSRRAPGRARQQQQQRSTQQEPTGGIRDEDILIAFMPYLRGNNAVASHIHEEYQSTNDQRAFLKAAREFLEREQSQSLTSEASAAAPTSSALPEPRTQPSSTANVTSDPRPHQSSSLPRPLPETSTIFGPESSSTTRIDPATLFQSAPGPYRPDPPGNRQITDANAYGLPPTPDRSKASREPAMTTTPSLEQHAIPDHDRNLDASIGSLQMQSLEKGLDALLSDDPIVPLPGVGPSIWGSTTVGSAMTPPRGKDKPASPYASPWREPPPSPSTQPVAPPPAAEPPKPEPPKPEPPKKKEAPPPKRVWTHFEEQPGRITVNGFSGENTSLVLQFGPRDELTAHWSLPLKYIGQYAGQASTLEEVLSTLTVGLFRRGCTENGTQASIISKSVMGDDNRSYEYWKDPASEFVRGKVPFYSPRTPGNVVFRLYWEKEPLYTLAMGPTILVRVLEKDFESSVRFILSNFKAKKSNPTSLSSLHSLATVLETPVSRPNESAARTTWGCIQEARKVMDACANEYSKTTAKLATLEESVEELKKQVEDEETKSQDMLALDDDEVSGDHDSSLNATLRDKTKALMSGRASCERKWRDSQLAFASILKAVVTNPNMGVLLRRDLIAKMRIEFELWCPLSEEFACPVEGAKMWYEPLKDLPHSITADDFRVYAQARVKMQMRTLGFDPNTYTLDDILLPRNRGAPNQRSMDPGAVTVFNNMSAAMGQYYQTLYANEDQIVRKRELIRERTEKCVQESGAFPAGTRVVIFGSSANGFGSPNSDIDMCLQIPEGEKLVDDETGAATMAKLAEYLEGAGMKDVDTARLTARIPIIMFHCLNPLASGAENEDYIECDLSMHNPLAVLNTSLLRSYAEITPVTRVLASIIKRWAKARDINNPSRHTLSSYGYIIMLIHFLTYHKRTGNGLVSPVAPPEGNRQSQTQHNQQPTPLLPNLQWMDPMWPNFPKGTPYRELASLPREIRHHPLEEKKDVNAYFYRPSTPNDRAVLQMLFPGQDLSLAILLASFFRYYAYEFDYKRFVVSLHSTASRGIVEREVKAELDGWRNYSAALTIEDPFEVGYDIAHVLRGGYYHRIRREFAVAYSKIADAASGRQGSWNKGDLRSMSGPELIDWICEPVSTERETQS